MDLSKKPPIGGLLLIAGIVTLVVTLVRLVGEWKGWDASMFSAEAGGRSWFGIIWLVPVFGILFGRRLAKGTTPPFVTSFFVPMFAAVGLFFAVVYCGNQLKDESLREKVQYVYYAGPIVALLGLLAWPRAFMTFLYYGLLARVPVLVVQYLDINRGWQTHYGKMLPGMPGSMSAEEKLLHLTLAQVGFWLPFTILLGGGMAALGAATVKKA
ncbi:MAG TPA: hypothetical protein VFD82_19255 [Planctomycetota bacterium]|nr:hypothetical protein [Planctomycetota bacterium]